MSNSNGGRKGALNPFGKESEQSKVRRGIKNIPDPLAGKGSVADKVKKARERKQKRLDEIKKELGL